MHLTPITYEEFTWFADLLYEISKKMLLEKVLNFNFLILNFRLFFNLFAILQ